MKITEYFTLILFLTLLFSAVPLSAQHVALKTNLLYWATTTPNAGIEIGLNRKLTLDISGNYNAWTFFPDKMSLRHYMVQPELRYWNCKRFEGHFFGVHGLGGKFNVGNIPFIKALDNYMYRGWVAGGGLSYGYHWVTGQRWGMEVELGMGYLYMEYDKYICRECAETVASYRRNYFGPTKLAVSIIYFIH